MESRRDDRTETGLGIDRDERDLSIEALVERLPINTLPTLIVAATTRLLSRATPTSSTPKAERLLLDAEQVAELTNLPVSYIQERGRNGTLPSVLIGKYRRYTPQDVRAFVDAHRDTPSAEPPTSTVRDRDPRATLRDLRSVRHRAGRPR